MPDGDRPELFLIDGNSLVYRAFFALPETIATSKGQPTNAIFGFASMLVKILTEHGQQPTLVVWDAGMSGRKEVYPEYKAQRSTKPDLLSEQWPHLQPLVDAFGYTNVKVDGFEADDVIASLATKAREQDIDVMVVTGDRDLFQLIEPGIRVMATSRGITETKVYDRDAVIDRYGIAPELVPDFTGLKGDTSDNIPGVPGIGEKTASQLLQEHGDLEGVLANIDSISGAKRKENLTNHADDARVSKQLATAVRTVEVDVDLNESLAREPDRSRLREVFREFELRDPLRRLEEALGDEEEAAPREQPEERIAVRSREVAPAELANLEGELLTVAARRAAPTEPPEGELLPADDAEDLGFAAYAGGEGAGGQGRDPRRRDHGARRAPAGGPRLEDDRLVRALRGPRAARARHDAGRLPDRPGPARLPARGAGERRGARRRRGGRRRPGGRGRRDPDPGRAPARAPRRRRPHAPAL